MESTKALEALGALAQASRLEVFRLLVRAGPEGVPATEIARAVGAPASTMSSHLGILSQAGLISARRESRTIFYSINLEGVRGLFDFLAADCCGGRPELCAPLARYAAQPCGPPTIKRKAR
ncbi:MAG: ArsR/SmtB family transcription factor [Hyphomonadaceae bacterium]